jgi:hypothetical protein
MAFARRVFFEDRGLQSAGTVSDMYAKVHLCEAIQRYIQ